jgi:hypothetical protein
MLMDEDGGELSYGFQSLGEFHNFRASGYGANPDSERQPPAAVYLPPKAGVHTRHPGQCSAIDN